MRYRFLLSLVTSLLISNENQAEEVLVGFGENKPPYVIGQSKSGLEIDIFREALAVKGHQLKVILMPKKRLHMALSEDSPLDAVSAIKRDRIRNLHYVDKFIYFDNYAVSKKSDQLQIKSKEDLIGLPVVAWQNAHLALNLDLDKLAAKRSQSNIQGYREISDQTRQNQMFWKGHVKVILIDKTIFGWYRKQLPASFNTKREVVFHDIFPGVTYYQVAFRRKELADDFRLGLQVLRETGRYEALYRKYIE